MCLLNPIIKQNDKFTDMDFRRAGEHIITNLKN